MSKKRHSKQQGNMKRVRGRPNLSDWNLTETEDELLRVMKPLVLFGVSEVMGSVIDGGYADMPAIWGDSDGVDGPPPKDPLTVRITFDIGDEDSEPMWETTLREALGDTISYCADDGSWSEGLERIMVSLRELADEIEQALPAKETDS